MAPRAPHALLLDLDGTLLDGRRFRESLVGACREVAARRPVLDAERLIEANAEVWGSYWTEVGEAWTLGTVDDAGVRREAWRRTLAACGCDEPGLAGLAFDVHSRLAREGYRAFEDVHAVFEAARVAGVPLALVTNGGAETQREKLRALGIEDRFEVVVVSGEIGTAKPDPEAFEPALAGLGVAGEHAWHVGDSLAADVAGARSSGITAVWLNRDGTVRADHDPEPDLEICSLSELVAWLCALCRGACPECGGPVGKRAGHAGWVLCSMCHATFVHTGCSAQRGVQ